MSIQTDKKIQAEDSTGVWIVPVHIIAKHRADYFQKQEGSCVTQWQLEYNYAVDDVGEAIDWFCNNMDWADVAKHATLVKHETRVEPQDWCTLEWDLQ